MAWIYLAESGESDWLWSHGCEQSPIVKESHMLKLCCSQKCEKEGCPARQSGMMCVHCERRYLEANESTLFSEASHDHARILVLQEMEKAWRVSAADFSLRSLDLQVSLDRDSSSWRTCQLSLFGGLTEFVWSSQKWGMICDGQLYQPHQLEPPTCVKDGSYLPTITAQSYGMNQTESPNAKIRPSLQTMARKNLWPTPTVMGNNQAPKKGTQRGTGLATAVKNWATPNARDWKDTGKSQGKRKSPNLGTQVHQHSEAIGGQLNPQWVEWLMGYQIGWTELNALAMQWFHSKRVKRLKG